MASSTASVTVSGNEALNKKSVRETARSGVFGISYDDTRALGRENDQTGPPQRRTCS